ncbi:tRNA (adenosine(37)-N6)-threonylcarbamoyltransferase complex dimerization subunit type 1 TsaB [Neptuniibacter sp. SY11_33]|uniref:tRNA (adenosine(37)-N6)-threonylcarbamoyltransferase complex dimerization subunit type 1 TsaB n=1 Tax=Neptuniibacter sp. SY11_33 TaxID=3398215 RepID=UPI0039F57D5B
MSKILALDTSTDACSVALSLNGEIQEDFRIIPRQHTQQLLPMVQEMLASAELAVTDLDAIAFGRGPGSFAGIRIATGVTQGLAYAADLPVLPVSTLAALALAASDREQVSSVVAALDARMNEIYVASYQIESGELTTLLDEKVCAPAELSLSEGSYFAVGSGWRYLEDMSPDTQSAISVSEELYYPSAAYMLKLAEQDWTQGKAVAADKALPVYLRDEVAWKKKDQQ